MKKKLLFLGRIISYPLIDEKGNQWYLLLKQLFILLLSMFWGTNHSNIFGLGKFQTYTKVKKKMNVLLVHHLCAFSNAHRGTNVLHKHPYLLFSSSWWATDHTVLKQIPVSNTYYAGWERREERR